MGNNVLTEKKLRTRRQLSLSVLFCVLSNLLTACTSPTEEDIINLFTFKNAASLRFQANQMPDHLEIISGQSQSAIAGDTLPEPIGVVVKDSSGAVVPNAALEVTMDSGNGTVSGSTVFTDESGSAFIDWTLGHVPGPHSLSITGSGEYSGSPKRVIFNATANTGSPSSTTSNISGSGSGTVIADGTQTSEVTITLKDQNSNPIEGTIPTFRATDTGHTNIYAPCSASNASGVSICTLASKIGEMKILEILTPVSTIGGKVKFLPGAASQLVFITQPSTSSVAGSTLSQQPSIAIRDPNNNTIYGDTSNITLSLYSDATCSTPLPATPSGAASITGTVTVEAYNGVADFEGIKLNHAGNSVHVKAESASLQPACSDAIYVSAAAVSIAQSSLKVSDDSIASGSSLTVIMTAKDAYGNPNPSGITDASFSSSAVGGTGTFDSVTDDGTGVYTSTFTAQNAGLVSLSGFINSQNVLPSPEITITSTGATQLIFSSIPSSAVSGNSFSIVVTAIDASGNSVPGYSGTVSLGSSDSTAILPASSPLTNGSATFAIMLHTAGPQTITVSDENFSVTSGSITVVLNTVGSQTITASDGIRTVTSGGTEVSPSAATQLVLSSVPTSTIAGNTVTFLVTAKDAAGNTATGYRGTVGISSSDGIADLPASATLSNGMKTFTVVLKTAGSKTITASDGTYSVTSSAVIVNPGAYDITQSSVIASASSVTSGSSITTTLTARDAYGNANPTGLPSVSGITFTSSNTAGTGAYGAITDEGSGIYSAPFTGVLVGSVTLGAMISGETISRNAFVTVSYGPASQLVLSSVPTSAISGNSFSFTVTAKDAAGNIATGYTGTVAITSSDSAAILPSSSTLTNGVGSFNVTLTTAGTKAVTATDNGASPLQITSSGITVDPGPIATIAFTGSAGSGQPNSTRVAGVNFTSIQVMASDAAGNLATNASDTITLELDEVNCSDGGALGGTLTVALSSGAATFTEANSQIVGSGYCLQASTNNGVITTTSSSNFSVTVGTQTQLIFTQQPPGADYGSIMSPAITVAVSDAYGNIVSSNKNITLSLTSNPGGAVMSGTLTRAASGGVATFNDISLDVPSTGYVITATCSSSPCLFSAASAAFNITNTTPVNLQTAIDMVDGGASSNTSTKSFSPAYINMDTNYYDGTVSYQFEIVAKNTNTSNNYNVTLNSKAAVASGSCTTSTGSSTTVTTLTVNSNTANFKRFIGSFTPTSGARSYFIRIGGTSVAGQLQVASARIIVTQTNARKTRIYVPLVAGPENSFNLSSNAFIDTTSSTSYTQPNTIQYYTWNKDVAHLANLAASNTFELNTVMASTVSGTSNSASLFNATTGAQITTATNTGTSTSNTFCSRTFQNSDTGMTDNHDFELRIKSGSTASTARLFKAGLWVSLQGIANAMTYHRLMRYNTVTTATTYENSRRQFSLAKFTNPSISYQCTAMAPTPGFSAVMSTVGTNDTGTGGLTTITGSGMSFVSTSKTKMESGPLTITDGDRFLPTFIGSGSINYSSCFAIIKVN